MHLAIDNAANQMFSEFTDLSDFPKLCGSGSFIQELLAYVSPTSNDQCMLQSLCENDPRSIEKSPSIIMINARIMALVRFVIEVSIIYTPSSRNWIHHLQM